MYEEDRARERWKALAKRMWQQRNEAIRQRDEARALLKEDHDRSDELDDKLATLLATWTKRAASCDKQATDGPVPRSLTTRNLHSIRSGTIRQICDDLMGVLGLAEPTQAVAVIDQGYAKASQAARDVILFGGKAGR